MSQQFQGGRDSRVLCGYHPYYSQAQTPTQTRTVSRYHKSSTPTQSPRPPSAFEKFQDGRYSQDGEYLAWVVNVLTAPDTNEPQRKQLDPRALGRHGGTQELGERVFGWMGNPHYDASIYDHYVKK